MTKYQHFVPQFYLGRFTNSQNLVEVLDLELMKCAKPRGTTRIGGAEFFYGIETGIPDETSQKMEDMFQKIESYLSADIDSIVEKIINNKQIESGDKVLIAFLMSMLWMRGPAMREQIQRMSEEMAKWMIEQEYSIHPDKKFDEFDKANGVTTPPEKRKVLQEIFTGKKYEIKFNNAMHLQNLENIEKFANLFYHQHWTVYISKVSKKFVTTDNPMAIKFPKVKKFLEGRSFLERSHYFPLTPDIFIVAAEPHGAPDQPGLRFKRKTLLKGSEAEILDLNIAMVRQANQYVYATNKQDLEDLLNERKRQQEIFATPEGKILKARLDAERRGT